MHSQSPEKHIRRTIINVNGNFGYWETSITLRHALNEAVCCELGLAEPAEKAKCRAGRA